jgi:predicted secreted protein
MGVFSAFVVFAMVWAMVFLIGLQVGQHTQGDEGERVPGTHDSSPTEFRLGPRVFWATAITVVIWGALVWLVTSGLVTIDTLRWLTGRDPIG